MPTVKLLALCGSPRHISCVHPLKATRPLAASYLNSTRVEADSNDPIWPHTDKQKAPSH